MPFNFHWTRAIYIFLPIRKLSTTTTTTKKITLVGMRGWGLQFRTKKIVQRHQFHVLYFFSSCTPKTNYISFKNILFTAFLLSSSSFSSITPKCNWSIEKRANTEEKVCVCVREWVSKRDRRKMEKLFIALDAIAWWYWSNSFSIIFQIFLANSWKKDEEIHFSPFNEFSWWWQRVNYFLLFLICFFSSRIFFIFFFSKCNFLYALSSNHWMRGCWVKIWLHIAKKMM